jgi:hypothetical protein
VRAVDLSGNKSGWRAAGANSTGGVTVQKVRKGDVNDNAIGEDELGPGAVRRGHILDGEVVNGKIPARGLSGDRIGIGELTRTEVGQNQIILVHSGTTGTKKNPLSTTGGPHLRLPNVRTFGGRLILTASIKLEGRLASSLWIPFTQWSGNSDQLLIQIRTYNASNGAQVGDVISKSFPVPFHTFIDSKDIRQAAAGSSSVAFSHFFTGLASGVYNIEFSVRRHSRSGYKNLTMDWSNLDTVLMVGTR